MLDKLKALHRHISELDSGSDDANTLLWAINEIANARVPKPEASKVCEAIREGLKPQIGSYGMNDVIANPFLYGKDLEQAATVANVYNAIQPYLRSTEPVSDDLLKALKANDSLLRDIRHRDARWHDDELVRQVLDANRALLTKQEQG